MSRPLSSHSVPVAVLAGAHEELALMLGNHVVLDPADGSPPSQPSGGLALVPGAGAPPAGELPVPDLHPAAADGPGFSGTGIAGTIPAPGAGADSLRVAVGWFGDDRAFALQALRPAKARGHDRDHAAAIVFEAGAGHAVEDPRLSITAGADGRPRRVGLELWLESVEGVPDYPRRAAGEVVAAPLELEDPAISASVYRVRWRSRGETGPGAFLLIRPRPG